MEELLKAALKCDNRIAECIAEMINYLPEGILPEWAAIMINTNEELYILLSNLIFINSANIAENSEDLEEALKELNSAIKRVNAEIPED